MVHVSLIPFFFLILTLIYFPFLPSFFSLTLSSLHTILFLLLFRIDANVAETELNIEAGYSELLKYFKGVTSNRWLMVKIFAVIIVFFIIFIVFLT